MLHVQFYAPGWIHLKGLLNTGLEKQHISHKLWNASIFKSNTSKKKTNLPILSEPLGHNYWITWIGSIPNLLGAYAYSVSADRNSTKSRGLRRAKTHRPLSRPTPQTLMLTMGCEWRTVRSMGSIRFSMSFSSIRYMSLPCNSRQSTVTQYTPLSNWLGSRCYAYAV